MGLLNALTRRKPLQAVLSEQTSLGKVLSTTDLIALGVGSTLGVGVYVLPGVVAKDIAGPGVVLSFLYAAIASVLAGLCYAEFGARVPKAGSAYVYSYVTVGEFVAFIIGWNLIIEYIIGGASVAKGLSVYLDSLFDKAMADYFRSLSFLPNMDLPFLSDYVDLFACGISVFVCLCLAVGLKESIILNNLLTTVNCLVVVFVIIIGGIYADLNNWSLPSTIIPKDFGKGGFLPYGLLGTFRGAATCFYGFVGFDVIATSGEEARDPRRSIPISIIVSLTIIFLAYSGVSSVLTLMWPYFLQDVDAPIPYVFVELDMKWAAWVVTIGGLFGLGASLFGGMFPLPRIIYAMSQDGLLFQCLGRVHPKFKTPFLGTVLSGIITGLMAAVFSLKDLVDLMSMATLVCYTIVAMSVLILRYQKENGSSDSEEVESTPLLKPPLRKSQLKTNRSPFTNVSVMVYILTFLCGVLAASVVHIQNLPAGVDYAMWPFFSFQMLVLIGLVLFCFQLMDSSNPPNTFQVPWLPLTPTLSIIFNLYLMFLMSFSTWIRFFIWLSAGLIIYFAYGLRNSKENKEGSVQPKGSYVAI